FFNPSPWLTLPFGSKSTNVQLFPPHDTTITVQGQTETLTISGVAEYIGTDKDSTLASGNQARVTITVSGTTPIPLTITSSQTFSFDGTIGNYFHEISNTIFPDIQVFGIVLYPGSTTFYDKTLTSFTLVN